MKRNNFQNKLYTNESFDNNITIQEIDNYDSFGFIKKEIR